MHRHRRARLQRTRRVKLNHPGHFMPGDQGFTDSEDARSAVSVIMQIRAADPDVAHPQPHLVGIWLGAGNLLGPHVLLGMDPHRTHTLILPFDEASSRFSSRPSPLRWFTKGQASALPSPIADDDSPGPDGP